jgi:tetraacyldisaccharide 4'-kinase
LTEFFHAIVSGQARGAWPNLLRTGLGLAAIPYGWAVALRNYSYDRDWLDKKKAEAPVVSVGNLTLGGTGKTPCVEYVARHCQNMGSSVAILSRGYGGLRGRNDEALVLESNLPDVPHLQGTDRAALARRAFSEFGSEILILDDGFQHRRLERDLDLVLIDATNPWGLGHLFPRGLLREKPRSLRRAAMVVLTRCDQVDRPELKHLKEEVDRFAPGIPVGETIHRPAEWINSTHSRASLGDFAGRSAVAFCGIGNPEAFRKTLAGLGIQINAFETFPDHHRYSEQDLRDLEVLARDQPTDSLLITTQKDLVKIERSELGGRQLWALRIHLEFLSGQETLDRKLDQLLYREPAALPGNRQLQPS